MRSIASVRRASSGTAKFSGMNLRPVPGSERYSSSRPQRLDEEPDGLVEVGHGERDVVGVPDAGDAAQLAVGARRHARGPAVEARTSSSGFRTT